jgi:two-component system LytT family response regulator
MIRALIVDDEPLAREGIRLLLEKEGSVTVAGECRGGREALEAVRTGDVDLIFLDVQMPEMGGFEMLRHIPREKMPLVVFVTAYDRYAMQAFKVHAVDYLLKPFSDREFLGMLARVKENFKLRSLLPLTERLATLLREVEEGKKAPPPADRAGTVRYVRRIAVRSRGSVIPVDVDSVDYFEAADDYVTLHAGARSFLVRETLTDLESKLDPEKFIRVHRSAIVRIASIREIRPTFGGESSVILQGGVKVTLGKTYRNKLRRFMHTGE